MLIGRDKEKALLLGALDEDYSQLLLDEYDWDTETQNMVWNGI